MLKPKILDVIASLLKEAFRKDLLRTAEQSREANADDKVIHRMLLTQLVPVFALPV